MFPAENKNNPKNYAYSYNNKNEQMIAGGGGETISTRHGDQWDSNSINSKKSSSFPSATNLSHIDLESQNKENSSSLNRIPQHESVVRVSHKSFPNS